MRNYGIYQKGYCENCFADDVLVTDVEEEDCEFLCEVCYEMYLAGEILA